MSDPLVDAALLGVTAGLVAINGFFVAAEFALVKLRPAKLDELVRDRRPFAKSARWLAERLDAALAACQLGITIASLALGWVGEPALADLLQPVFHWLGVTSQAVLHGVTFTLAFAVITSLHLVIGEQLPKIYAIRRPERLALWCAPGLRLFYILTYPLLVGLSGTTSFLLRRLGIDTESGHEPPPSEEEIRILLRQAHLHGDMSRSKHRLMDAVLEFDDTICRRVMLPRADVVFLEVNQSVGESIDAARRAKHTRYPVCENSLDRVLGVVHIKDMYGVAADTPLASLMRPPRYVPETMPVSRLLRHFQAIHQHLAFVVDEYGNVIGIVTLENVLEQIVGPVEDEFDTAEPEVVPQGEGVYVVLGSAPLPLVNAKTGLKLRADDVDTLSGLLTAKLGRIVEVGDRVDLDSATGEVLEVKGSRATRVLVRVDPAVPNG